MHDLRGMGRLGIAILWLKILLVPIAFDAASEQSFTVPKAMLSHALSYALAGIVVALLIRHGWSVLPRSPLHVAVLVFFGVSVVATVFAPDPYLALYGPHARMLGLGTIGDWVIVYFAVSILVRSRADVVALCWAALVGSAVVLEYEAVQLLGRDPFSWAIDSGGRPFSTLGQPTLLGVYLITLAAAFTPAAIVSGAHPRTRLVLAAWIVALLVGAALSGTRSILFGLAAAGATIAALVWLKHPSRRARVTAVGAAGAALLIAIVLTLASPLGARVLTSLNDQSAEGRADLYGIALKIVEERPLLGYGPDSFVLGVPKYRPQAASPGIRQSLATSAHGWIAYIATSSGALGLVAFLAMIATAIVVTLRRPFSALGAGSAAAVAAFLGAGLTSIDDISTDWMLWVALGGIVVATTVPAVAPAPIVRGKGRRRERRSERPSGLRNNIALAIAGAGVLAVLISLPALNASRSAMRSVNARVSGRAAEAIEAATTAVHEDPGRAEYWHTLGFAYIAAQHPSDASNAFAHAAALAPYDIVHIADDVQVQFVMANAGDRSALSRALTLTDKEVRIDPNDPRPYIDRAVVLQATGDLDGARTAIERAMLLDPGSTNERLYTTAVEIMTAAGRTDDAIRIANDGLAVLPSTVVGIRVDLARAYIKAGRLKDALDQLNVVLSIQPNLAEAQQLRTQVRAAIGQ